MRAPDFDTVPAEPKKARLWQFRGSISSRAEFGFAVGGTLALLVLWELIARSGLANPVFLPAPTTVLSAMGRMITDQGLLWHAGISTLRVWAAFVLAAAMAIPIGILMSSYRVIGASLEPVIDF